MGTFKAEYQKYLDKLKGVDLTPKSSALKSNISTCVNNVNNLKGSISSSAWKELGEETLVNSVIPSVAEFTEGLSSNIDVLDKAASMAKELVSILEELKAACDEYDALSLEDYAYTDDDGNKQYHYSEYNAKKEELKKKYEELEEKVENKLKEIKALTVDDLEVDASELFASAESASVTSDGNMTLTQVSPYEDGTASNIYMVNTKLSVSDYVQILKSHYDYMTQNTLHPDQCLGYSYKHSGELLTGSWTNREASNHDSTVSGVRFTNNYYTDKQELIQKITSELTAGRPCVLMVNGHKTGTGRHYVTVVGISESAMKSGNVSESDLAIIDSYDGHVEMLKNDTLDRSSDHTVRSIYKDNDHNTRYQIYTLST